MFIQNHSAHDNNIGNYYVLECLRSISTKKRAFVKSVGTDNKIGKIKLTKREL